MPRCLLTYFHPGPMEPAIGILADVRAYFQGSEHIFSFALTVIDLTYITRYSRVQTVRGRRFDGN